LLLLLLLLLLLMEVIELLLDVNGDGGLKSKL